jgi:hypothetical protein
MEKIISLIIVIIRFVLLSPSLLNFVYMSHPLSFSDSSPFVFLYPNNGVLYCFENDRNWLVGVYTPTALIPKKELILFASYTVFATACPLKWRASWPTLLKFESLKKPREPIEIPWNDFNCIWHSNSNNLPKITVKISSYLLFYDGRLPESIFRAGVKMRRIHLSPKTGQKRKIVTWIMWAPGDRAAWHC